MYRPNSKVQRLGVREITSVVKANVGDRKGEVVGLVACTLIITHNIPTDCSSHHISNVLHLNGTLGTRAGIGFGNGAYNTPIDTPVDTVDVRVALASARLPGIMP